MPSRPFLTIGSAACAALALLGYGYAGALADPVVRRAEVPLLPADSPAPSITLLFATDLHVAGPDMPPSRLQRIVGQMNALHPDLVLLGGDFVSDKRTATHRYTAAQAVAPLAALRPRLGTLAVLGNHDHWRGAATMRAALDRAGVGVLANGAARRGPLAVGGVDDAGTGHADLPTTLRAMHALGGAPVLLTHSPDIVPAIPGGRGLVLIGHTHCGQVRLPLVGTLFYASRYGARYGCGLSREHGHALLVSAGVGTSILPIRLGVPPDLWLVRITRRPAPPHPSSSAASTSSSPAVATPHASVRTTGTPAA